MRAVRSNGLDHRLLAGTIEEHDIYRFPSEAACDFESMRAVDDFHRWPVDDDRREALRYFKQGPDVTLIDRAR